MFLQSKISLTLTIYNVLFSGANQSPFIDLQYFYMLKSVSLFSIYKVFTGSNQFPFFFLQEYYRFKPHSLFWFTMFLQGQISLLIYMIFTRYLRVLGRKINRLFPKKILWICVKHFTRFYMVSYPLLPKDAGCKCFLQLIIYTKKLLNSDWLRIGCSSFVTRVQITNCFWLAENTKETTKNQSD